MRTSESKIKEVFVNLNDLLIDLHKQEQACSTPGGKAEIQKLIHKITALRTQGHKKG